MNHRRAESASLFIGKVVRRAVGVETIRFNYRRDECDITWMDLVFLFTAPGTIFRAVRPEKAGDAARSESKTWESGN
jgi:hypothetical protein